MKRLVAMGLALMLALGLCGCGPEKPEEPDPTPTPEPAPVLAFFGASTLPWSENSREWTTQWCEAEGWTLVEYDCLGLGSTRDIQIGDLLRSGGADLAVLCALGDWESLNAQAAALAEGGVDVITLSDSPLEPTESALCCLGPDEGELWGAASAFFRWEIDNARVVILRDSAAGQLGSAAQAALETAGVTVLEEVFTWGSVEYGQQFLADALARHGQVTGVLCFSRTGALAAQAALVETGRREEVKTLCLDSSQRLLEDLERGELDGLATINARATAQALETALTQIAQGKVPVGGALGVEILESGT